MNLLLNKIAVIYDKKLNYIYLKAFNQLIKN